MCWRGWGVVLCVVCGKCFWSCVVDRVCGCEVCMDRGECGFFFWLFVGIWGLWLFCFDLCRGWWGWGSVKCWYLFVVFFYVFFLERVLVFLWVLEFVVFEVVCVVLGVLEWIFWWFCRVWWCVLCVSVLLFVLLGVGVCWVFVCVVWVGWRLVWGGREVWNCLWVEMVRDVMFES